MNAGPLVFQMRMSIMVSRMMTMMVMMLTVTVITVVVVVVVLVVAVMVMVVMVVVPMVVMMRTIFWMFLGNESVTICLISGQATKKHCLWLWSIELQILK